MNINKETKEFLELQAELLKHKHAYYILNAPLISDYSYDIMEKQSFELARKLGFRADEWLGPEDNEKHHVHWMVGYDENYMINKENK